MSLDAHRDDAHTRELRLFVEEVCCNLTRFHHAKVDGVTLEQIDIEREVELGPGAFADIRVSVPGSAPYFIEVKLGYPRQRMLAHLGRKYGPQNAQAAQGSQLIVVVRNEDADRPTNLAAAVRAVVRPDMAVEIWDERRLLALLHEHFGIQLPGLFDMQTRLLDLRTAIDRAKAKYAFGTESTLDDLQSSLMWHFGFWRLRDMSRTGQIPSEDLMPPGLYRGVTVLFADLSAFSSYVRDTRDDEVVRYVLTSFYAKARAQVLNDGGMLYQFLGDGMVALFGIPNHRDTDAAAAMACGRKLLQIGASVMNEWQRQIDPLQPSAACHIGMAMGDINLMPLRPFSRTTMGAIGECINVAARLTAEAGPHEMVISNALYRRLPESLQQSLIEADAVEARNIGRIQGWRYRRGS